VQVIAARSMFSFGLDVLGATQKNCVDGAVGGTPCGQVPDGTYFAWLGQLQWARRFDALWGVETVFRTDIQLSNRPLLGLEQFAVGGHATVRGYRENQFVRDQGVVSSLEVRIPVWSSVEGRPIVQLAPFFDVGRSWNSGRPTPSPETISSVGIGLRWAVTRFLDAQLYWGQNLKNAKTSGTPQGENPGGLPAGSSHDLQDDGVQFSLRMQLP
jgi:hemolysin activation/secretion protein